MRAWHRAFVGLLFCLVLTLTAPAMAAGVISLPRSLTEISESMFEGDTAFDTVVIPDGVTSIGSRAFAGCDLRTIIIPASVESIASDAFDGCLRQMTVYVSRGSYANKWFVRKSIPCYYIETMQEKCKLALEASEWKVSYTGGSAALALSDTIAVLADTDDGWLDATLADGTMTVTARPNESRDARTGSVSLRCLHGCEKTLLVTQSGVPVKPQLHVSLNGEELAHQTRLPEWTDPAAWKLTLGIAAQDARLLRAVLTNAEGEPVECEGASYLGAPVEELIVSLPDTFLNGEYTLRLMVSSTDDFDGGEASTAEVWLTITLNNPCCPVLETASCALPADGDTRIIRMLSDEISSIAYPDQAQTDSARRWLDVTHDGASLSVTARANYGAQERTQTVQVTCVHGKTVALEVTQAACEAEPSITVSMGDTLMEHNALLGKFDHEAAHTVTLDLLCENVRWMRAVLLDAAGNEVSLDGLPYSGRPVEALTFTLPEGISTGAYQLRLTLSNAALMDDAWQRQTVYTLRVELIKLILNPPKLYSGMSSGYKSGVYYTRLMSVNLTGNKAYDIVEIARSQVGYHEGALSGNGKDDSNINEYSRWLGYIATPWCASFVSWCAYMAEADCITPSIHATPAQMILSASAGHVYSFRTYAEVQSTSSSSMALMNDPERCTYVSRDTFMPQMGDLIYIASTKYHLAHIGIVTHVSGGSVHYIDGNGEDMHMVKLSSREMTDEMITMYARPNY